MPRNLPLQLNVSAMCQRLAAMIATALCAGCSPALSVQIQLPETLSIVVTDGDNFTITKGDCLYLALESWIVSNKDGWKPYRYTEPVSTVRVSGDKFHMSLGESWVVLSYEWSSLFESGSTISRADAAAVRELFLRFTSVTTLKLTQEQPP